MKGQPWYISHAETLAQNVIGQILCFLILHIYGVPIADSLQLQLVFLIVAYTRGYLIRRFFNYLATVKGVQGGDL